ncbi:hypothetical protein [Haloarcula limicola]|uniref:hypothetical protein n=1 Tax=Haloarcula limicola TaxID=1429915 RepID=UPI001F50996C|nr:hypothetical protein [Halomicroarcula limicola]
MKRRAVLRTLGTGVTALGSGCLGGGGEVIVSIQRDVTVDPQNAWIEKDIPDLSDSGGAIEYIVRSETPFDVYFFADGDGFSQYDSYIKGHEPDSTPSGHPAFSQTALPKEGADLYEASTADGGNREPVEMAGPYHFAVDHSNYRMETRVEEYDDPLTAFVDLKVIRSRSPL